MPEAKVALRNRMVSSGVYVYTPLIDQMAGICKVSVNDFADGVDIAYGKLIEGATLGISRQGVSGCANAAACKQTAACANQGGTHQGLSAGSQTGR